MGSEVDGPAGSGHWLPSAAGVDGSALRERRAQDWSYPGPTKPNGKEAMRKLGALEGTFLRFW